MSTLETQSKAAAGERVEREQWERYLEDFSLLHAGTVVRLELLAAETGPQVVLDDLPLLAITLDDEAGAPELIIECGDAGGDLPRASKQILSRPTEIQSHADRGGQPCALKIDTRDSGTWILTVNPHPGRERIDFDRIGRSGPRG